MTDFQYIVVIIIVTALALTFEVLWLKARRRADTASRHVTHLYRMDKERQDREAERYGCPQRRIWHRRTTIDGLCFDIATGTLTTHNH